MLSGRCHRLPRQSVCEPPALNVAIFGRTQPTKAHEAPCTSGCCRPSPRAAHRSRPPAAAASSPAAAASPALAAAPPAAQHQQHPADAPPPSCCSTGRCGHTHAHAPNTHGAHTHAHAHTSSRGHTHPGGVAGNTVGGGGGGSQHWAAPERLLAAAALVAPLVAAGCSTAQAAAEDAAAAATAAATVASGVVPSGYVPSPQEPGWEIWIGFAAGVIPFMIGSYEFGKRIIIQLRCEECGGRGLVPSAGAGRERYLRKCPQCGGFFPWISWKMFLSSAATPGNGGPLQQPRGQTSVFYSVPDEPDAAKQAEARARSQAAVDAAQAGGRRTAAGEGGAGGGVGEGGGEGGGSDGAGRQEAQAPTGSGSAEQR